MDQGRTQDQWARAMGPGQGPWTRPSFVVDLGVLRDVPKIDGEQFEAFLRVNNLEWDRGGQE